MNFSVRKYGCSFHFWHKNEGILRQKRKMSRFSSLISEKKSNFAMSIVMPNNYKAYNY